MRPEKLRKQTHNSLDLCKKTKRTESIPNLTKEDGELTVSDQEQSIGAVPIFQLSLYA